MTECAANLISSVKKQLTGRLLTNEMLAKYTSWRVGGPARQLYLPAGRDDLLRFLRQQAAAGDLFWMGQGSNLLIRDGGINGTVINTRGRLKAMALTTATSVTVEAGASCAQVARFCVRKGLTGGEFLAGIPGTIGGALKMNAGAFGGETWNIVNSVQLVNTQGELVSRQAKEFAVSYRRVEWPKQQQEWFLTATLHLTQGEALQSEKKIRELLTKRAQTQPTNLPSCGSVFRNPPADHAARLIELSGLKGHVIGGARVSDKHANFIVNTGRATAADIEALIEYVAEVVVQQQGVRLETEVCIVGEKLSP